MVKQYVGARYVPKFATPVEWAADTSYEALTIVTFNNASYTSKVPVPPTVGNPANNPQYWALTGNYNAQVEQYRQTVETYKNDTDAALEHTNETLNTITPRLTFTTPEYYGAKGDGVTNDTLAFQQAIDSGLPVLASGNYFVNTITITKSNTNILFHNIQGNIVITSTDTLVQHVNITGDNLVSTETCLTIKGGVSGIQYITLNNILFRGQTCVQFDNTASWTNQIVFNQCGFSNGIGLETVNTNNNYDGIYLNNCGFEDIEQYVKFYRVRNSTFNECRMIPVESGHSNTVEFEVHNCYLIGVICSSFGFYFQRVTGENTNINFYGIAFTDSGIVIATSGSCNVEHHIWNYETATDNNYLDLSTMSTPVLLDDKYNFSKILYINPGNDYTELNMQTSRTNWVDLTKPIMFYLLKTPSNNIDIANDYVPKLTLTSSSNPGLYTVFMQ